MGVVWWIVVGGLVLFLLRALWKNRKPFPNMPGPTSYPIIGSPAVLSKMLYFHELMLEWRATYGKLCQFPFLRHWYVLLSEPNDVRLALQNNNTVKPPFFYSELSYFFGPHGLPILPTDQVHVRRRKIFAPMFSHNELRGTLEGAMERFLPLACDWLGDAVKAQKPINAHQFAVAMFSDINLNVLVGRSFDCLENGRKGNGAPPPFVTNLKAAAYWSGLFLFLPFLQYVPVPPAQKVRAFLHNAAMQWVNEGRTKQREQGEKKEAGPARPTMLQRLFAAHEVDKGEPLSDDDIRDECLIFMLTAGDTSATSTAWVLYELARNPDLQDRVAAEARVLNLHEAMPTLDSCSKMPFLEACIKESLRMHTTAAMGAPRVLRTEQTFQGTTLPKGTLVWIATHVLQNAPDIWQNPEKYDPERFLDERKAELPPNAYMPFLSGAHNCIGQTLGLLNMKMVLGSLLARFRFAPPNGIRPADFFVRGKMELVLVPGAEASLLVSRREA
jgi:cytochrome P450